MKTNLKSLGIMTLTAFFTLGLLSFTSHLTVQDDWVVPAKYKTMKNPQKDASDDDGIGKSLYKKHCQSCHGKEGFGDGTKAAELKTELRDFTSSEVQSQTDGELYYKAIIGKDEMPNFEKKIPSEEDRWLLINYLRTLK